MLIPDKREIKFLFISSSDLYGGASLAGYHLHKTLMANGHTSTMVVNSKLSNDSSVIELNGWYKQIFKDCINGKLSFPFSYRIGKWMRKMYYLFYDLLKINGHEVFFYPATKKILSLLEYKPDVIHLHTIHGNYFDLRIINYFLLCMICGFLLVIVVSH